MKTVIASLALSLAFASSADAQVAAVAADLGARHVEAAGRFSYSPPAGWQVVQKEGQKYRMVVSPVGAGVNANISVNEEASEIPLADFVSAGVKTILGTKERIGASKIDILGQSEFVTASKHKGVKVTYRIDLRGTLIRGVQYTFDGPARNKLIITGTSLESDANVTAPLFDRVMKTFQVEK